MTVRTFIFKSSNLVEIAHDDEARTLIVTFTSGARYEYDGVDLAVAEAIAGAKSPGSMFHSTVRTKQFSYRRLADGPAS